MWRCEKCGWENSDNESRCQNCRRKKERKNKKNGIVLGKRTAVILCVILVVTVGILWLLQHEADPVPPPASVSESAEPTPTQAPPESESAEPTPTQAPLEPEDQEAEKEAGPFSDWTEVTALADGMDYVAGLKADGTVLLKRFGDETEKEPMDVSSWEDIVKICSSGTYLVGLKEDGSVVATGNMYDEEKVITSWTDMIDISLSATNAVGVRRDGRIEYAGSYLDERELEDYASWRGVRKVKTVVCGAGWVVLGFKEDGTLVNDGQRYLDVTSSGWLTTGIREDGSVYFWGIDAEILQPEMLLWRDIKQVCPGDTGAIGLQNSGRLVFAGYGHLYEEAKDWDNIDRIFLFEQIYFSSFGFSCLAGIRTDGTVVTTADYLIDTSGWTDIIDIVRCQDYLVGLRADGTLVSARWSDTLNPKFAGNGDFDIDAYRDAAQAFDNGWLTFVNGGSMYVPDSFIGVAREKEEPGGKRSYSFFDIKTNTVMEVTEEAMYSYPGVQCEYSDSETTFYLDYKGVTMDLMSALYEEMRDTYPDAPCFRFSSGFQLFGNDGSNLKIIRYQQRGDALYSVSLLFPASQADYGQTLLQEIEEHFLAA